MRARWYPLLDFLPPVVAFIAAIVAVIGAPKWDTDARGLAKVTTLGWAVLVIGLIALGSSLLVTVRNHRQQREQAHRRERIAQIGMRELLRAVDHATFPFKHDSIYGGKCEAPPSPLDLLDQKRREVLAQVNLNSASPYAGGSFEPVKWCELIQNAAVKGTALATTALQIYASYLPPMVMEITSDLLNSPFLRMGLLEMHELILANTYGDKNRRVPFFWVKDNKMHGADYENFWRLVAAVMAACSPGDAEMQTRPQFLRH
jgi:hypothetical protein